MTAEESIVWGHRPLPATTGNRGSWSWTVTRPAEINAARNALRDLDARSLPDGADDDVYHLLLAFEELASNGLRHGGEPVQVQVESCDDGWLLDVSDARPDQPPVPAVDRDPALGGLGLHLVARLSAAVGWTVVGTRKHVWAALVRA